MKKKYIIIGIVIIVLLRLVSCNSGNKEETENKTSENTQNVVVENSTFQGAVFCVLSKYIVFFSILCYNL